ncbi:MAG: hypothetical protein M2R45_03447 [Verrucomicrobia subdivision 3 bacterium]|nr:hypothetical protein [Limisphaerales bacterium]MCS1415735.1 hypothetical protein [Limisphaerales bacterium]
MIVIAVRLSMGKALLAMNITEAAALDQTKAILRRALV